MRRLSRSAKSPSSIIAPPPIPALLCRDHSSDSAAVITEWRKPEGSCGRANLKPMQSRKKCSKVGLLNFACLRQGAGSFHWVASQWDRVSPPADDKATVQTNRTRFPIAVRNEADFRRS